MNNQYVLTDYDIKRSLLWSVKRDSTEKFIGKLRVELEDNQGNKSAFETMIDSVSVAPKSVEKAAIKTKQKTHEPKNRRQSPKLRAERPKRKHR